MTPTGSNSFKGDGRRSVKLNEGLDKRLESYAAAASAAGVGPRSRAPGAVEVLSRAASVVGAGLLLTAGPASAHIVYTPANTPVQGYSSNPFPLDLNHDGITDFQFTLSFASGVVNVSSLRVSPAQAGNAIVGKIQGVLSRYGAPLTCHVASALPAGHRIGPGKGFGAYRTMVNAVNIFFEDGSPFYSFRCGYWGGAQGRFLGFEFTIQGQTHFGWARFNESRVYSATLTGYAYETQPNTAIRAGDRGPVADARVPEMHSAAPAVATLRPATLGLLALGSAGLDIWRKEQDQ